MTQRQQSQRPMRVQSTMTDGATDSVISVPQPAEACCGDFDEPEIGSVERLHPDGRQAVVSELDDVA